MTRYPRESYLCIDRIIDVTRRARVDAVHPGYGFLAENAEFAQACADAGVAFVGPAPEAIRNLGDKVLARKLMRPAGIPVVPGGERVIADAEDALAAAEEIGYPVLIKASAGGGGKGMRSPRQLPNSPTGPSQGPSLLEMPVAGTCYNLGQ